MRDEVIKKLDAILDLTSEQAADNDRMNPGELTQVVNQLQELLALSPDKRNDMAVAIMKDVIDAIEVRKCDEPAECVSLAASLFRAQLN